MLWLLGGHDPTHGAGLYRDLVTARGLAPGMPRRFAVTALTEQGRGRAARAFPVPAARLRARVSRWPRPLAIKLGLVPDALAWVVAELVAASGAPVVVDPVLRASDGGALGATPQGLAPLLAVATLVTPNRGEALALLAAQGPFTAVQERSGAPASPDFGAPSHERSGASMSPDFGAVVQERSGAPASPDFNAPAQDLPAALGRRFPATAILLKDGHGSDPSRVVDRLVRGPQVTPYPRPRVPGPDPRGTGCALATAIAVGLAQGLPLDRSVTEAIAWLDAARTRWHPGPDGRAHLPDDSP